MLIAPFRSSLAVVGIVTVTVRRAGRVVDVATFHNLITDDGLDELASTLTTTPTVPELDNLAWGLDDGTVLPLAATNTALGTYDGERPILKSEPTATKGERVTTAVLRSQDANVQIEELGWFTTGGTLYARVFYSRLKDALESITVQRTDALTRTPTP